ncbi:MAG TPA: ParB/RepB/Spo0J family partition protein [Microvirga sp.]|jgi:ParB family chromosome partitioning protein|nr:ParB/RepB/Spo0J family partition protein [Microvirga sp.]
MALDLSFTRLADIAQSGGGGRPVEIPLDDIVEDPDQPRRVFDEQELADLAASIKERGVLQAISVRPRNRNGKHVIIFGARRYRASRLAGRATIRAVIEDVDAPEPYIQLIENIQRDDLKPVEIAAFVTGRLRAGDKAGAIAERLGKPKDWVSRYAAVAKMPDFLQAKLETSPIRAVYELYQAWREHPDAVERLAREHDTLTDAQARRLVQRLRTVPAEPLVVATRDAGAGPLRAPHEGQGQERPAASPESSEGSEPPKPHAENHPSTGAGAGAAATESALALEVRRLERYVRKNPALAGLVAHYDDLTTAFANEFEKPRDVLLSRRAALLLIKAVSDR